MTRLGILLSGRGSNFLAIQQAIEGGELPARIALVVSNVVGAPGIAKAAKMGLATTEIPHRGCGSRTEHERRVLAALAAADVEWVCLAGYMRLLSARFINAFPQRILNIHPSLLPAFPGLHAQRQAWDYGVKVSGCTVHLVDEGLDSGPILVQRQVEVCNDDTVDSLAKRILEQEHQAYPEAIRRLLTEPWEVEGRRVRFMVRSD